MHNGPPPLVEEKDGPRRHATPDKLQRELSLSRAQQFGMAARHATQDKPPTNCYASHLKSSLLANVFSRTRTRRRR